MDKNVLIVGHCGVDGPRIEQMVESLGGNIHCVSAASPQELKNHLHEVNLVLFNREIVSGFSERSGIELLRKLKQEYPEKPMMLVSDLPDAQRQAVDAGALPGFGKSELASPRVANLLKNTLQQ